MEQTCPPKAKVTRSNRVGCANLQNIIENIEDSPSGKPFSDDHSTILLHNSEGNQGLTVSDHSRKSAQSYSTKLLHIGPHFVRQGGRIHYRRRVPTSLVSIVGKKEIWRSLGTDRPPVALKRSHQVAAAIERDFEIARSQIGQNADSMILAEPRAHAVQRRATGTPLEG